ncbi:MULTISPECIES: TetR/AcrR family transcriptional regulator [Sphingomonadaceae]|jgi:AcrR family transcriptional regulator|uniref:TetR/AcrR family transcriptional regulator n=1 Tax=Sphingomonadales TaxID=204457 RepID=UPI00087213D3|nr:MULTISPECIES: TetR/AcrR family transcriptional regulator [Sphingomonadaceae]HCW60067.1 TetR/AcrR family transcriptional regulator [Sphingobium sp.]MBN8812671.1 TetR family transcriptional regulator [Sphingomonas sp.]OJY53632.1 MAG: TetR family transcriptional regulator [Sphingomonas sp. 67-41]RQW44559.1 TetR/AcrR family transcriptional regulator [Novosphingobium sp. LASN5T]VVT18471.1 TetR family transcriptional regulator [Sphingomonas sp. EC-HK361]|tara:strand:- start:8813 stop:9418 length:606 start_codon:yes stop_codon:yes gene_type:complete
MARTQAPDYEERRIAIVDKAAELFARRGFTGASLSDLAAACQTSKSLIYHYFPSKEDILYEVMSSHIDQLVEDTHQVAREGGRAADQFNRLIHAFLRHYMGAASRQKVLLNELAHLPDAMRETIVSKQRQVVEVTQKLLTALTPGLAGDPKRARVQTMLLFGMINWTHTWYDPDGDIKIDELAEMVLELIGKKSASGKRAA